MDLEIISMHRVEIAASPVAVFSSSHRVITILFIIMMSLRHIFFLIILVKSIEAFDIKDMTCTDEYCAKYIEKNGCPTLSEACRVQNSTHNGVFLPFPDICNCCDFCLENLAENEPCSRGIPGFPPPEKICGPGLECTTNSNGPPTCQRMKTSCTKAQDEWDRRRIEGTLGMTEVRPKCDDDGLYAPVHCIPGSICYCIATNGQRIFGEIPYLDSWDENKMSCGCSLNNWKAENTIDPTFLYEMSTARCNDYGLYDSLQCMMGSKANCLCVDPVTGEPKKDTTVPLAELKVGKPSCFDPSIHSAGIYETDCEMMKRKWIEETTTTTTTVANFRMTEFDKPQCQPDGNYHRVQIFGTKQICVDPSGQQIDQYEASNGSPEATRMDCNCARTRWLLSKAGVVELPSCCPNGSFKAWQCRRKECFCVDNNGDQIGREEKVENIDKLKCYKKNANGQDEPCSVTSSSR